MASRSAICSSHRKSFPHFAAASKRNSTLNTPRILSPGLNFSICAEELMSGLGLLHKDRREFLQAFQCSGKRQVLGAVGHP